MNKRHVLMGLGLVVASWFAFFADKTPVAEAPVRAPGTPVPVPSPQPVAAPAVSAKPASTGSASASVSILPLRERAPNAAGKPAAPRNFSLFGATGWDPPPPKAPSGPPPPPQAPPLPYRYLGKKFEAGHWEVYLGIGDDARLVRPHSTLDEKYRVDTISPPTLRLTYLPLMQVQSIPIGTTE